ncbi:MAG: GAP family protein [Candidatus Micrarchaeia archaeon]
MLGLLISVLPLAIGSCLSPGIFALMIAILSNEKYAKHRAFAVLFGGILVAVFLAFIGYLIGTGELIPNDGEPSKKLNIGIGIFFILFALYAYYYRNQKEKSMLKNSGAASPKLARFFFLGFLINITNFDAVTLYTIAVKETFTYATSTAYGIIITFICSLFFLLPELLPLGTYLIYPKRTKEILEPLRKFLQNYGTWIIIVLFIVFGIYFILRGINS